MKRSSSANPPDRTYPATPSRLIWLSLLLALALLPLPTLHAQCGASANSKSATGQPAKYVKPSQLRPELRFALEKHGPRLTTAGQERLVSSGTLSTRGGSPVAVRLTQELPNLTRLDYTTSSQSVGFDGSQQWKSSGSLQSDDQKLLESLAYDSSDRFFLMQANGVAPRHLGNAFRIDGQVKSAYSGPRYNIYYVVDTISGNSGSKTQGKYYLVNFDTLLVERVFYQDVNTKVPVQIVVDKWMKSGANTVPQTVRRLENNVEVWRLQLDAANAAKSQADATFCAAN
jgi:hypothetical protein